MNVEDQNSYPAALCAAQVMCGTGFATILAALSIVTTASINIRQIAVVGRAGKEAYSRRFGIHMTAALNPSHVYACVSR